MHAQPLPQPLALSLTHVRHRLGLHQHLLHLLHLIELILHLLHTLTHLAVRHVLSHLLHGLPHPLHHLIGLLLGLRHLLQLLFLLLIEILIILNRLLEGLGIIRQLRIHARILQRLSQLPLLLSEFVHLVGKILQLFRQLFFLLFVQFTFLHLFRHLLQRFFGRPEITVLHRLGQVLCRPLGRRFQMLE